MDNDNNTIEYANENWRGLQYTHEAHTPRIVRWVIEYSGGLVKDEKQAHTVLLGVVGIGIVTSLFFFFSAQNDTAKESRVEIERMIRATDAPQ
jgi:hypothetical protein